MDSDTLLEYIQTDRLLDYSIRLKQLKSMEKKYLTKIIGYAIHKESWKGNKYFLYKHLHWKDEKYFEVCPEKIFKRYSKRRVLKRDSFCFKLVKDFKDSMY